MKDTTTTSRQLIPHRSVAAMTARTNGLIARRDGKRGTEMHGLKATTHGRSTARANHLLHSLRVKTGRVDRVGLQRRPTPSRIGHTAEPLGRLNPWVLPFCSSEDELAALSPLEKVRVSIMQTSHYNSLPAADHCHSSRGRLLWEIYGPLTLVLVTMPRVGTSTACLGQSGKL